MKLSAALPVILGVALQVFGQQTDTAKFLAGLEEIPAQVDRINSFSADSLASSRPTPSVSLYRS